MITPARSLVALILCLTLTALEAKQVPPPVAQGKEGRLVYNRDTRGDQVPDFSSAGYRGGGIPIPSPDATVVVAPLAGDNTRQVQAALDYVASLPPNAAGHRGCLQLAPGRFAIGGQLRLTTSGVVLRGSGTGDGGSVLVATGTDRRAVILVGKRPTPPVQVEGTAITTERVAVGAREIEVADATRFKPGDFIRVYRPSPAAWINELGMHESPGRQPFEWKPGSMDLNWDRQVSAVAGHTLVLDAPLTTALEQRLGGGTVFPATVASTSLVREIGLEHLVLEAEIMTRNPKDEDHAWTAVHLDAVQDAWVSDLKVRHFAGSAVYVSADARRVTVQDCVSLEPVSEAGGYRRLTFHTAGQQTLFLRCRAVNGRQDFTTGHLAAGPNVFLHCSAETPSSFSGSIGSWASGVLFDNLRLEGGELRLDNLEIWNQGVGWAAANSVVWQTSASVIICRSPPGANNWAAGVWGQFIGSGPWSMVNEFIRPDSLYRAQLAERLGIDALRALEPRAAPALAASTPRFTPPAAPPAASLARDPLVLTHGWLTFGSRLAFGRQASVAWWRGSTHPNRTGEVGPALTRFVPDRIGTGLTDDLEEVADRMKARGEVALRHNWGLWYDRRRDDHQMIRRADGDVWPPFFEQPWARSGDGVASNGLSRYDLTRFNPWYFSRLAQFAQLARTRSLVLVNEMYFQHNVLEAGAHWAEFPWRTLNTVSDPGFPEPPPYVENKRIFMAEIFYDVDHPRRRELHRAYIRHCLANLAGETNVIHTLGEEFSGPLRFYRFWLDVVAEWEAETGQRPLIALSAPKDVQDAILEDPRRSALIDVIDLKYWWQTEKGLYAPAGGQNLAPRQHERLWKGGKPTAADLASMVRATRERFPNKAVIVSVGSGDPWRLVTSGASFVDLPANTDPELRQALATMHPGPSSDGTDLVAVDGSRFVYRQGSEPLSLDLPARSWRARWIDRKSGQVIADTTLTGGPATTLKPPRPSALWISPTGNP